METIINKYDVAALGELLVDFTACGVDQNGMRIFAQNPGGAPANVLCALSNLGKKTAFIGKVGRDMHGEFLRATLKQKGIDVTGLIDDPDVFTTLAFVDISGKGERSFSFARKPGADTCLSVNELPIAILSNSKVFHFGSLSLTDEPSREATYKAIHYAKSAGALISYDPNYREPLWINPETAAKYMRSVLDLVDIIKISREETEMLSGEDNPEYAAKKMLGLGIKCVVVTLGSEGALLCTKDLLCVVPTFDAPVVDTTGAGDAFWGGFLFALLENGLIINNISLHQAKYYLTYANAVATLCVGRSGAIPAMPSSAEVNEFLRSV